MTKYTSDELDGNWEFKIVRSASAAFRKPEVLQQVLAEEAMAGWELLEKLDDSRLRLKRPRDARKRDDRLPPGVDPYRTYYGTIGENRMRVITLMLVGLLVLGIGAAAAYFALAEGTNPETESNVLTSISVVFTTVILLVIAVTVKMRTIGTGIYSAQRSPAMIAAIILGAVLVAAGMMAYFLFGG
ncbi:MAG: hypothetical protein JXB38_01450 [Anaerolineales bacterium]|nr:hypothetical protein [Anaerolineales bacterium]